jgi:hypothetical protein
MGRRPPWYQRAEIEEASGHKPGVFLSALPGARGVTVIFLFLRNFWATIIPAVTVPLSLIGTFAVLYESKTR